MAGTNLTGVLHIVFGVLAILFYAVHIGIKVPFFYLGAGIWGGFFWIVAGGVGMSAAKSETRGLYVLSFVFGLIAFLCAFGCTCISAFVFYYCLNIHPDRIEWMPMFQVYLAFNSLFFITSFLDLIISVLHIKASLRGYRDAPSYRKTVRPPPYNPDPAFQPQLASKY